MLIDNTINEQLSVWSAYGLKSNPFSTEALPAFGGDITIANFFGRDKESNEVQNIIYNNSQSRILITGDIGIGKTTFVNHIRAVAFEKSYFTIIAEIGIDHSWEAEDFMRITLSSIYTSINRIKGIKQKFDKEFIERLGVLFGMNRGHSVGLSGSISLPIGGVNIGGDKSRDYGMPHLDSFIMRDLLREIVENLTKVGYKGLVIHYNNLEFLNERENKNLIKLFNGIRDFLQIEKTHFIFVGDYAVSDILQRVPRVDGIFFPPIHLKPFNLEEVCSLIDKRVELLQISKEINILKPYSKESIDTLYKLFSGNIRAIFKSLATAIIALSTNNRPIVLYPNNMGLALKEFAEDKYVSKLNQSEINVLIQIMKKGETTNKLISESLKQLPQNVSNAITELRKYGCIRLSRIEGRARYYVPAPEMRWLFFNVEPRAKNQKSLE